MQEGLRKSLRQVTRCGHQGRPARQGKRPSYSPPTFGGAPAAAATRYAPPEVSRMHGREAEEVALGGSGPVYGEVW